MGNRISPAKAAAVRLALTIASTPSGPERDILATRQGNRVAAAYAAILLTRGHSRRRFMRRGFLLPGERRGCGDVWIDGTHPIANWEYDQLELGQAPQHLNHGLCHVLEGLELRELAAVYCSETEDGLLRALDVQLRTCAKPHM